MNHPLSDMMTSTMAKIKDMIDVNTVIGDPITTPDGVTIIPVTKVSIGYGSGGSDFAMSSKQPDNCFGGGAGGSVKITPIAFLIIRDGNRCPTCSTASTPGAPRRRRRSPDSGNSFVTRRASSKILIWRYPKIWRTSRTAPRGILSVGDAHEKANFCQGSCIRRCPDSPVSAPCGCGSGSSAGRQPERQRRFSGCGSGACTGRITASLGQKRRFIGRIHRARPLCVPCGGQVSHRQHDQDHDGAGDLRGG